MIVMPKKMPKKKVMIKSLRKLSEKNRDVMF